MADDLQATEEANWLRVDADVRRRCVEHLRDVIPADQQAEIRDRFERGGLDGWFHMSGGMAVRNALRDVVADDEMPGIVYEHVVMEDGSHPVCSNWDDFYMAALRQAVAPRDGEA